MYSDVRWCSENICIEKTNNWTARKKKHTKKIMDCNGGGKKSKIDG